MSYNRNFWVNFDVVCSKQSQYNETYSKLMFLEIVVAFVVNNQFTEYCVNTVGGPVETKLKMVSFRSIYS